MNSHRRTLAAALATLAASLSLYPIFTGIVWFWDGVGAILVVAGVGTLTRRRRLPFSVCLGAGLAGLLIYLNLSFENAKSLYHLLPTPGSIRALWDLAGLGFSQASKYAPPVPELAGMLLLATAGIGIAALLTDFIAVRLEYAALAGLPLLLLFTEPFTLSISRGFLGTTVAFALGVAGYLGLLSSEARDRIREWEQPDPTALQAPDTRGLAAAGRRVGFASVVLALFLPIVIPGLHVTRLFGGEPGIGGHGGGGGPAAGFPDLNTQLSQELRTTEPMNILTYTSTAAQPDYLQIYALSQLTDDGWKLSGQPLSLSMVSPLLPTVPGLTSNSAGSTSVKTQISVDLGVGQDNLGALPVPYPATQVQLTGGSGAGAAVTADKTTLMVLAPDATLSGLSYTVISKELSPPVNQLEAAGPAPDIRDTYLTVPDSYKSLTHLAKTVAGNQTNQFQEAIALQNWLSGGSFTYTVKAPAVVNAQGLKNFLKDKKGYCQQFSFAMAVMARLLGIPSRIAYGFTAGTGLGGNKWLVTSHDAHAWPELYFAGFGWLRFEPTPSGNTGQGSAVAPSYTLNLPSTKVTGPTQTAPGTSPSGGAAGRGNKGVPSALRHELLGPGGQVGGASVTGGGTLNPWEIFGLVMAGLILLAVAAPWSARLLIRTRRWRGRPKKAIRGRGDGADGAGGASGTDGAGGWQAWRSTDADWAHAAWLELRDNLVDYGAGYLPSESPRTVAARAGASLRLAEPATAALGRIAMAEERARYAARPVNGSGLRADSATLRRAIAAAVPRRTRWRGRLLPPSVVSPALGAVISAADVFGRLSPEWQGRRLSVRDDSGQV